MRIWFDFGTSNSVASYVNERWEATLLNLWNGKPETRTVLFWDEEDDHAFVGDEGIERFIDGREWRLIQSPKTFLSLQEEWYTLLWGQLVNLTDIVTHIIENFRVKISQILKRDIDSIRVGRPVKFHDTSPELDRIAESRLATALSSAWFKHIEFELEPLAAAKTFPFKDELEWKLLLVADFGWGTSDFSLVNFKQNGSLDVVGNNGVNIAGNSFDYDLSISFFSGFLWRNSNYRVWDRLFPVPSSPYFLLSDWKSLHRLNDPKNKKTLKDTAGLAERKTEIWRLLEIVQNPLLGYLYFKLVEDSKISLSDSDRIKAKADFFENTFDFILSREDFSKFTESSVTKIRESLEELLVLTWVTNERIWRIMLVGGTWKVFAVQKMLEEVLGHGKIWNGDTFGAVGLWLSID